jgi:hypothetical protein
MTYKVIGTSLLTLKSKNSAAMLRTTVKTSRESNSLD